MFFYCKGNGYLTRGLDMVRFIGKMEIFILVVEEN